MSPFVGRQDALDHLGGAVAVARLGRFAGVLIGGPAGIGKSRLVEEFLSSEQAGMGRRLSGAAVADGEPAPLELFRELLHDLEAWDGSLAAALAAPGREQMFRAVAEVLRSAARSSGGLVVTLEDLHWADATSLELLAFLGRRLVDVPVLVIATFRDGHELTPQLRRFLVETDRAADVTRIELGPLERAAVADLAGHKLGRRLDGRTLGQVMARSEGVTLFVEELVDATARGEVDGLPGSVRELFGVGLDQLGADAQEIAELASVCGSELGHDLLVAVAELPEATLEKRLDDLLDAGVLVTDRPGSGYRFRHALLHETVRARLRPAARRRLHRRCAQALTRRPDLTPTGRSPSVELARHWSEAGEPGPALTATLAVADEAAEANAYPEALRREMDALTLLDRVDEAERGGLTHTGLLARAADSADRTGEYQQAVALYQRALAASHDDPDQRTPLQLALTLAQFRGGDHLGAARSAAQASEDLGDRAPLAVRALLLLLGVGLHDRSRAPERPAEATVEALELARRAGDPDVLCTVLCARAMAQAGAGRLGDAQVSFAEAERLTVEVDDPRTVLRPSVYRMVVLHRLGRTGEVAALGRDATGRADRLGVAGSVGQQLRTTLVDALLALGRWEEAATVVDEGLLWGDTSLSGGLLRLARANLAVRQGRFAAARADLAAARERFDDGHPRCSLVAAELAWWQHDLPASGFHAARGLEQATAVTAADDRAALSVALVRAVTGSPDTTGARDTAGSRDTAGARDIGDHDRGQVAAALDALAGQASHPLLGAWHATAVAEAAGARPGGVVAWEQAAERWRHLGHRPMLAWSAWRAATAHLGSDDPAAAGPLLAEAESLAAELAAAPLLAEIRATSTPRRPGGGLRSGDRAGNRAPSPGDANPLGMTGRELEVLVLVAEGWTNKRIAAELFISARTVASHVSQILRKTDVRTRGQAAAVAHRLQLAATEETS